MDLAAELERRHANIRAAMGEHGLDALIVSGNEYSGFEGAVTYVSGFQIVHRYAYVVIPADGDAFIVFPTEARYVGEHGTTPLEQVFHARPGEHIAAHAQSAGWKRVGVYGLDYIMAVRDYAALDGLDLIAFDVEFDLARAVKSEAELESVRDSVRINQRGFELWHEAYAPGKTAAEVMAAAEEWFIAEGCGRLTMNMVLTGTDSFARPEFKIARSDEVLQGFVLPSLEVAGPGMHWVEVSRAVRARDAEPSDETKRMMEAYVEYYDAARSAMHAGATCHDVHIAVSKGFPDRGYHLGHVTGHSIGMTMIEFPKVGEGSDDRAAGEHGPLDAPARDRRERRGLPLHAGHLARDRRRRRAARRPGDGDLGPGMSSATSAPVRAEDDLDQRNAATGYTGTVTWPWIVLLAIGVGVVVAAEWPRFERLAGADARRLRDREKRKAKLTVISTDDDEFVRSVQADLEALPTIEERETPREER